MSQKRTLGEDTTRLIDVLRDLLRQRVGALESQLVAQPAREIDADAVAVEVALEVEDERFEPALAAAERGAYAEAGGGLEALSFDRRPDRIDAVARQQPRRRDAEIHRRITERSSALLAVLHYARHGVRAAEQARGGLDRARDERVADARRAHDRVIDGDGLLHVDGEAVALSDLAQRRDVTGAV